MKKYFQQIVCSLLILIMVSAGSLTIFTTPKAEATTSLTGYISKLTPVITKLPGCKDTISGAVSSLAKKIVTLFSTNSALLKAKNLLMNKAMSKVSDKLFAQGVTTQDPDVVAKLAELQITADETAKNQKRIADNQNCLNGIGKSIAKVLINEASDSIVNWIKTGDSGGPLFIQDPAAFFRNIQQTELLGFAGEVNDPELYPFAKSFLQTEANSFKNKFANNAKYSLNQQIIDKNKDASADSFNTDFSKGGWYAWDAQIQNAANNPMGFTLAATDELGKRIEKSTGLAAGSLQQSGGYFGLEKCAVTDPTGREKTMTREIDNANRIKRSTDKDNKDPICTTWRIATPGSLVGEQLVSAFEKHDHALLDVTTLNDAMAAILDAALAKWTSSIQVNGLTDVTRGAWYETNDAGGIKNFQNETDFGDSQINTSTWIQQHPDFNIRSDLNQALIDEQRIYKQKLEEQDIQILSTVPPDGIPYSPEELGNYGLIPTIYQLDYCLPGPHTNWEEDAQNSLESIQSVGFGNCTNFITQFVKMTGFTGVKDSDHNGDYCTGEAGFDKATNRISDEYASRIHQIYDKKYLPTASKEIISSYNKLDGYYQILKNNQNTIELVTATIARLGKIKESIDAVNKKLANQEISLDDYENGNNGITPWKNAFARISSSLYSGDDIDSVVNATKGITDEKDYIFKNLLKGPTGCEEELKNGYPALYDWQTAASIRPAYPKPHLYDYPDSIVPKTGGYASPHNWSYRGFMGLTLPGTKPATPQELQTGFIPYMTFYDRWGCGNDYKHAWPACGDGDLSKKDPWLNGIIDISGVIATYDGPIGGSPNNWENALGIW